MKRLISLIVCCSIICFTGTMLEAGYARDYSIDYGSTGDFIGKDDVNDGAIKKLDEEIDSLYTDLNATFDSVIGGDDTEGRIMRIAQATFLGIDSDTVEVTLISRWNGDALSSTEVDEGGDDTYLACNSNGSIVTIKEEALSGMVLGVLGVITEQNSGGHLHCLAVHSSGDIQFTFTNAANSAVSTTVASRNIIVCFIYITDQ